MTQTLKRSCWWCNKKLMAVSHAEVVMPDGNVVWVHKVCEAPTRNNFKPVTAQHDQGAADDAILRKYR